MPSTRRLSADPATGSPLLAGASHGLKVTAKGQRLTNPDLQYWALGLGILAVPILNFAQSKPLSCVILDNEKKKTPRICGFDEAIIPDFCWKSCMGTGVNSLLCWSAAAVALQAMVVLLNHGRCWTLGMVKASVDLDDDVDQFDERAEQEMISSGWNYSMLRWAKKLIMSKIRGQGRATWSHHGTQLVHGKVAGRLSQLCICFAGLREAQLVWTTWSGMPSYFSCHKKTNPDELVELELQPISDKLHIFGFLAAVLLLLIAFSLQFNAKWTLQVELSHDDSKPFGQDIVNVLEQEMLKKSDDNTWYAWTHLKPDSEQKFGAELNKFQEAHLKRLAYVEHDGFMDRPEEAFKSGGWEGPVVFHFKGKGLSWEDLPDNKHRFLGLLFLGGAALFFFLSATQCWTCVKTVHARTSKSITQMEMQSHLLLLGTCGRHGNIGNGCGMAVALLLVASLVQAMVIWLTDAKYNGGQDVHEAVRIEQQRFASENDETQFCEHLFLKLFARRTKPYSREFRRRAQAGLPMQKLQSYVWVSGSGEQEEVKDCQDCPSKELRELRKDWHQSKVPHTVELRVPPPSSQLVDMMSGLLREDFSPPTVCILEDKTKKMQMVPPQFLAGRFHIWVNLGPKLSWEKISGGLSFCSCVLGACDLLGYSICPFGSKLQNCDDVLNHRCTYFEIEPGEIEFRPTTGPWLAVIGAALALFACLFLRVAHQLEAEHDLTLSCKQYILALGYIFQMAWDSLAFVFLSLFGHMRSTCKKHCCRNRHLPSQD